MDKGEDVMTYLDDIFREQLKMYRMKGSDILKCREASFICSDVAFKSAHKSRKRRIKRILGNSAKVNKKLRSLG